MILAELRSFRARSVAQAPAAHGNFRLLPASDGLLLHGDYSRQMQRLATTTVS